MGARALCDLALEENAETVLAFWSRLKSVLKMLERGYRTSPAVASRSYEEVKLP
jgi:hypothetical protein